MFFNNRIRILYDHQIFSEHSFGGVSRIFFELLDSLSKDDEYSASLSLKFSNNIYLNNSDLSSQFKPYLKKLSDNGFFSFPSKIVNRLIIKPIIKIQKEKNKINSIKLLKKGEYDIFHPTYYDPYFLEHLNGKPFVLTVHDSIHELFPEYFYLSDEIAEWKSQLIKSASKIIAISENTKNDLIKLYKLPKEKIEVVYLANSLKDDSNNKMEITNKLNLPGNYLLYIGNRVNYKNFIFFVESIIPILKQNKTLFLVCGGGPNFTYSEIELFKENGIKSQILHYSVNDEILVALYKNAIAFVYPSFYEGFGIPILEAFKFGCPVLISNSSSLPEIAGDACITFNPKNKTSISEAVELILWDENLRLELKHKGKEREKLFSWKRTIHETKQVYKSILS